MPKFMVIPRDNPGYFDAFSPQEMQAVVEQYHAWGQRLAAEGRMTLGHKLRDGHAKVLRKESDGLRVTDGPYAETKEVIGGFWIIEADDLADAVAVIDGCPHLEEGRGSLEVREIEVMD